MNLLKELIERDQWAELISDSKDIFDQSNVSEIEVFAFSEKEAIKKALDILQMPASSLTYKQVSKGNKGIIGWFKSPSRYIFNIKNGILKNQDNSIDYDAYNKIAADKNGTFKFQMRRTGLMLTVYEPSGMGKPATVADIQSALKEEGYLNIPDSLISKAILNPKEKVPLAPYIRSENDATIALDISKDAMSTTLIISRPTQHGRMPEADEIISALKRLNVIHGINKSYIEEIIDNNICDIPVIVAEGTPVVHGENAKIEYAFSTEQDLKKHFIKEDGSIDFKELNFIQNVHQGDVVATITPATKGKNGMTVTGETIIATIGENMSWELGQNVTYSPDKRKMISTVSGQVYLKDGKVSVDPALEIATDVDLSTGNIDFLGNVTIKGSITDGFSVISGGNIEIFGHVGKCFLHAKGNIIAHQGIQGKDENRIECGGDLYARFIERSNATVGGNIIINKSLLHSHIVCEKSIYVVGDKKAIIAGGDVKALNEIVCRQFGAESYIETHLESGYSQKLLTEIKALNKLIKEKEYKISLMKEEFLNISDKVPQAQRVKLEHLITEEQNSFAQSERIVVKKRQQLHQLQKAASISAEQSIMPGVKIKIGNATADIGAPQSSITLKTDGSSILTSPYVASEFVQKYIEAQQQTKKQRKR